MKKIVDLIKNNKNLKIALGLIILVVIAGFLVSGLSKKKAAPTEANPVEEQPQEVVKTPGKKPLPSGTTSPVDTRTYTQLLEAYKDRLVQFNSDCHVSKIARQVFKVGSEILLDNRSSEPATISVGATNYTLSAYGYRVISLSKVGTFTLDCNAGRNVATLTVQE